MTENERRILRVLSLAEPLSKRDITRQCGIGWATAVKLISHLEEEAYVFPSGNERQNQAGKSATVYALSSKKPVALGIDVEYERSCLNAKNLLHECLFEIKKETPYFLGPSDLLTFLDSLLQEGLKEAQKLELYIEGVGIGIPNRLFSRQSVPYNDIAERLSERCHLPVFVDNNIRCFTAAVASLKPPNVSMLIVTIRSGIGVGIVIDGKIYRGERGGSGEMGHFSVASWPHSIKCHCGKTGCLETIVNHNNLLSDLRLAEQGDTFAKKRIVKAAVLLGEAMASMMLVLDIQSVAIYTDLGDIEQSLLKYIHQSISKTVYPGFEFELCHEKLDAKVYVTGAARLVLDQFVF